MNTTCLILIRIYSFTLGNITSLAHLLKKILILVLIKNRKDRYTAAAKYFDLKDFVKKENTENG